MTFRHLLESEKIAIYAVLLHHSTNASTTLPSELSSVCGHKGKQIRSVENAITNVPAVSLDNVFYTLQSVMECNLETGGSNKYKLQHIDKEAKHRRGELEESLAFSADTYLAARLVDL
ncbi:hypothetical protein H310_00745 [Aphanomyces invadans]|uniref:Uncharacterized protein n=1 Tax=Aphanomyces invadans TaxID=157072 RepID=A0A024UWV9_9STRA|nr:hypothetical protein H310_00745 [Aphanomyces invadans]ETW10440.1 hypothetical protein H310_00745 [Aphanomyces invadans]|eukprot:XP_008861851.1 hypothetical protein H310_00745 [Aphanomyces invadans]